MSDVIVIDTNDVVAVETPSEIILEVSGPQGPAGANLDWDTLPNTPATFPPSTHSHPASQITDFATAVAAVAPATTNAGLLTSGTLLDARLSTVVTTSLGKADTASQPGHTHTNATTTAAGFLSTADKTKLDGVATGAEVNVNADWTATTGDAVILNKPVLNGVITNAFPSGFGNGVANINWAAASYWSGSLGMTGGTTIAFQNVIVGKTITLDIGNSAGYLLQWPVGITWIGGSPATSALGSVVTSIRVQVLALSTTQFIAFSLVPFTDKPSTATSPGIQGQLAWGYDDGAERLYICVANNIWRRATIATWS